MNLIRITPLLCNFFLVACFLRLGNSQSEWAMNNVAESLHLFTNEIFQRMEHTDKTTNLVISPLSLFAALSLTSIGAKGSTLSQLQQALRLSQNSLTRKGGMAHIIASMAAQNGEEFQMDLANFVWVPRGLAVKAEYARSVQEIFQTRVRDADFTRVEEVRQVINYRIENITRGHITELFPKGSITRQTRLLLANALYFKGVWLHAFNQSDTYMQRFFMSNGKSIVVRMMRGSGTFQAGVLDNLGAKAILLPYQGNRYGLLCVLPDPNKELSEVESDIFSSGYTPTILLRRMIQRDVNITLPKFNLKFDMEMSSTLQKMGIRNLFTNEADLSGMSSSSRSAMLKVSNIYHQSSIEVNEGGSEASAASGFEITPLTGGFGNHFGPIDFRADRPFLFYLIDRENNNIPLIIGRVYNPLQSQPTNLSQGSGEQTMVKAERPAKISAVLMTPEFQSTFETHPLTQYIREDDHEDVIYSQKPSYFNYYNSVKPTANRYFSRSPPIKRLHTTPVIFPDENFDNRWKRETNNLTVLPDLVETSTVTSTLKKEDIDTRLKDPFWFNKPTVPEVIIPINTPESNRRPADSSRPSNFRPQLTSTPESATSQPLSPTTPPNIFFALPAAANPSSAFPVNQVNNVWNQNEQNIGGAPGYAPSNNDMTFLNNRPVFISPSWYPSQTNPYFQPYPSSSGSELQGIFFPEYRFSSQT